MPQDQKENLDSNVDAADAMSFEDMFNTAGQDAIGDPNEDEAGQQAASDNADNTSGSSDDENQNTALEQQEAPAQSNDGSPGGEEDDTDGAGSPKDDPERYHYWQSRADKAQAELEKFKTQVEQQTPLMRYINENPQLAKQVYSVVESHLQGTPGDGAAPAGSSANKATGQTKLPEKPEKPTKPSNYDPVDATSDPQSESFKYRERMEAYQEQLVDYNEALIEHQDQQRSQQKKASQAERQRQQQLRSLYQEARFRYKMDENKAMEFVNWVAKPDYSTSDLVAVFNARQTGQAASQDKAEQINEKNKQISSPPPPAGDGNNVEKHVSEPDMDDPHEAGKAFIESISEGLGMG